jgi:hypothetical protein
VSPLPWQAAAFNPNVIRGRDPGIRLDAGGFRDSRIKHKDDESTRGYSAMTLCMNGLAGCDWD